MTDLTKYRSSYNPWLLGFPSLPDRRLSHGPVGQELTRRSWFAAWRCRLRRNTIDRELAAGADPDSSECRHMRAAELTAASSRDALATACDRHVATAFGDISHDAVPVNWRAVRAAAPRLEHLARRLRDDPRVRAQGVARIQLLLTDRDSALYGSDDELRLVDEVRSTLALL